MTCPHERQEWRGHALYCAAPECPEGALGHALTMHDPDTGEKATFDRVLLTTATLALCGRSAHAGPPQQSWVWVRRGSRFNPRRE